jgi:ribosomal protein L28
MPNIQRATITINGVKTSARICTRCLRTLQKSA